MSPRMAHAARVVALALAGLVLAVALAILTSHLTTQHVGLAGEPLHPSSGLVSRPPAHQAPTPTPTPTTPAPADDAETERGDD